MMHQRDILIAAFECRGTAQEFDVELTKLFGSPFTTLSVDPLPVETSRRGWEPVATATQQKIRSQTEQRIVDVTLRDLMRIIHAIPIANKSGWRDLLDELTASSQWATVAAQIHAIVGPHDEASGFFWSGMLARALGATEVAQPVTATSADISAFGLAVTSSFHQARHPRAEAGNTVKTIKEMANQQTQKIASDVLVQALTTSALPVTEKLTVIAVVGAVTSADLWRHPSAVRYLLLPAIKLLRSGGPVMFSLDNSSRMTEDIINKELGDKWRARNVW
jgi:hypothetical protein